MEYACACGCGKETSIARSTNTKRGTIKGEHNRYLPGHGNSMRRAPIRKNERDRFNDNLYPDPNSGCYIFVGSYGRGGYGKFCRDDMSMIQAHRLAWIFEHGSLSTDVCVLHKCDTPSCCNADHLFLGDRNDNAKDRARKDRSHRGALPRGVKESLDCFCARIKVDGKERYLGRFKTIEEAAAVAAAARAELYGAK